MANMGDADFSNLLDLDLDMSFYEADGRSKLPDDLSINNPNFASNASVPAHQDHAGHHDQLSGDHHQQMQQHARMLQQHHHHVDPDLTTPDANSQNMGMFDFSVPMDVQFGMPQQHAPVMTQHSMIPPTPNSVEMHGDTLRYLQQMENQRLMMEQYHMKQNEQARSSFTPMVSPIVSSHDNRYDPGSGYTVPGAYFSPLTSPALEGQQYPYQVNTSASSATTSSPVEHDVDMAESSAPASKPAAKTKKRTNASRASGALPKVRSSLATKAQSKRKNLAPQTIPEVDSSNGLAPAARVHKNWMLSQAQRIAQQSPAQSASPEPLGDVSMGPPQKPASATQSPALTAKNQGSKSQRPVPATPASLMRIQQGMESPRSGQPLNSPNADFALTPLALPESATVEPESHSPNPPARKTPKLGPQSTPSGSATPNANMAMTPLSSITSPMTPGLSSKLDNRGRSSKKRGSMSTNSNLVSPALRPKISPSIKPLLPEGSSASTADEATTMFLASRSNYQNLIEGTHVPGVSYPQELSTNLTSKRTSHKIAEQGRRNRINLALQEMLRLLPTSGASPRLSVSAAATPLVGPDQSPQLDAGDKDGGAGGKNSGNSKAATVESAIEYIKSLKQEHEELRSAAEIRDRENVELRRRLEEMEKRMGAGGAGVVPNGSVPQTSIASSIENGSEGGA